MGEELGDGVAPGVGEGGLDLGFQREEFGAVFVQQLRRVELHLRGAGGGEHAVEGVVIALADGVELVVVAAGAGDGEALKGFREHVNLAVHRLYLVVERVHGLEAVFDEAEVREAEAGFVE